MVKNRLYEEKERNEFKWRKNIVHIAIELLIWMICAKVAAVTNFKELLFLYSHSNVLKKECLSKRAADYCRINSNSSFYWEEVA